MRTLVALLACVLTAGTLAACGATHDARDVRVGRPATPRPYRAPAHPVDVTDGWTGAGMVSAPGGPEMVDGYGRRLALHGVDLAAKCGGGAITYPQASGDPCVGSDVGPQPAYILLPNATDPGRRFTEADAATLQRMGFNTVRLGIVWEGMEPGPNVGPNDPTYCAPHRAGTPFPLLGHADPYDARTVATYLGHVDTIVDMLAAHGIRSIIDMQQDAFGSAFANAHAPHPWDGEGAPPWATCTDGRTFVAPQAWGAASHTPAVIAADHSFYANDVRGDLQGQFVRVWQAVAAEFAGNPDVLGYELINEPADFTHERADSELECDYGGPLNEPQSCRASGAQALPDGWIGAIRAVDPYHAIFYEPEINNHAALPEEIGITEPLRFSNLVFAFHLYHPPWYFTKVFVPEERRTRTLQPGGPAMIMDEFGSTVHWVIPGEDVQEADRLHISWTYWSGLQLHDPSGHFGESVMSDSGAPNVHKAVALGIPYAMATAGTPGATSWDATARRYVDAYRPDPSITAPTEIVLSRFIYPDGYRVTVTGARVLTAPGSPILELATRAGAREVTVTVTPRPAPRGR